MIPLAIKHNIQGALEEIADKTYQKQAWLGDPVTSDLGNVYEAFAYDGRFLHSGGYLDQADLNPAQKQAGITFAKMIDEYYQPGMSSELAINDPKWARIRAEAQKLLPILFPEDAARYARGQWQSGK